jgi:hypothetical protein
MVYFLWKLFTFPAAGSLTFCQVFAIGTLFEYPPD